MIWWIPSKLLRHLPIRWSIMIRLLSQVDIHFLVCMVDLWSSDGQQQRNVVMHPSSQHARRTLSPRRLTTEVPEVSAGAGHAFRPSTVTSRGHAGHGGSALPEVMRRGLYGQAYPVGNTAQVTPVRPGSPSRPNTASSRPDTGHGESAWSNLRRNHPGESYQI